MRFYFILILFISQITLLADQSSFLIPLNKNLYDAFMSKKAFPQEEVKNVSFVDLLENDKSSSETSFPLLNSALGMELCNWLTSQEYVQDPSNQKVLSSIYEFQEDHFVSLKEEAPYFLTTPEKESTLGNEDISLISSQRIYALLIETPISPLDSEVISNEPLLTGGSFIPPNPIRQTLLGWIMSSSIFCLGAQAGSDCAFVLGLSIFSLGGVTLIGLGAVTGFIVGTQLTHYIGLWLNKKLEEPYFTSV